MGQYIYNSFKCRVKNSEKNTPLSLLLLPSLVVGCPSLAPIPAAVVTKAGNDVTVTCNFTSEVYTLTCHNNEWSGNLKNCSRGKCPGAQTHERSQENIAQIGEKCRSSIRWFQSIRLHYNVRSQSDYITM